MSSSGETAAALGTELSNEKRLFELWGEIRDLRSMQELLDWDQETHMPKRGAEARSHICGTVAMLKHRAVTSDELLDVIQACIDDSEEGSVLKAQATIALRDVQRARKIPEDLAKAKAIARSRGTVAWQKAREASDFSLFERELGELLRLAGEEAAALSPGGNPYDALMDRFEPGATEEELVPLFDHLVAELTPMVKAAVESGKTVDESPVQGSFAIPAQQELAKHAASALGFDFEAGRLDAAVHPFCVGLSPEDVRMTWRWQEDDIRPALYGVLHEAGHGLYEQGLPSDWHRTPLGTAVSLGIHESQSRLFENQVGRSKGFWRWLWPRFAELFPGKAAETDVDKIWPALHTVKPTLIRVEADEGTYNLHVAIRFQIERALFRDDLQIADLPEAWNQAYEDYLGARPSNDSEGVLQDIHWSQAIFGYFPTYTLGTMNSAQLFAAAQRDLGDLEEAFTQGDIQPLLGWMREHVHQHGRRYEAGELIERATGEPRSPVALLAYLKEKTEAIYGTA